MAHVFLLNQLPPATDHGFSVMWSLSRALKKAGWKYLKSSDGSAAVESTGNPALDKWGAGTTVSSGAASTLASKTLDDVTVTGLTGMTTAHVGNYITFTGAATGANNTTVQIVEYVSATSMVVRSPSGVAGDANNGSISWTMKDPILDTYPTALNSTFAWWLAQGPTTVKLSIGAQPSGTFQRGEKVTQATSGAIGEVLGVVWYTVSTSSIIILPRVGTFDGTNVITGTVSGATVTPTGTVATFVEELVIARSSANDRTGWVFCQRVDSATESAQQFSGKTPTITSAPGNSTAANSFPTTAYTCRGIPNSTASEFLNNVSGSSYFTTAARYHVVAANAIGTANVSPDGTFWGLACLPGNNSYSLSALAHFRMDDTEDGDVDPFVWMGANNSPSRASAATVNSAYLSLNDTTNGVFGTASGNFWGWRKRGYGGTGDAFLTLNTAYLYYTQTGCLLVRNNGEPERIASHTDLVQVREPIWAVNATIGTKVRKGTFRWMYAVPQGGVMALWESKTWLQVSYANGATYAAQVIGPWDGTTEAIYA